jgi:pseudoazurin
MMMFPRAIALFVLCAAPLAALAADHEIKMLNQGPDGIMVFDPAFLKANPGDTVTFVSVDPGHDSVSVEVPEGAEPWQGEVSKSVTAKLDKEGVYVYKCLPHLVLGMVGVIQVGKPVNLKQAQAAATELEASIATNKERMQKYMSQVK